MCESLNKTSSSFTLQLIKALKNDSRKVTSDLKTIVKTDFPNLRFLELCLRQSMSINLNYIALERDSSYEFVKNRSATAPKLYIILTENSDIHMVSRLDISMAGV